MENKVTRIDQNGEQVTLSNLVNSLSKGIFKSNVTMDMIIKNVKFAELNINIVTVFLNTQTLKMI